MILTNINNVFIIHKYVRFKFKTQTNINNNNDRKTEFFFLVSLTNLLFT